MPDYDYEHNSFFNSSISLDDLTHHDHGASYDYYSETDFGHFGVSFDDSFSSPIETEPSYFASDYMSEHSHSVYHGIGETRLDSPEFEYVDSRAFGYAGKPGSAASLLEIVVFVFVAIGSMFLAIFLSPHIEAFMEWLFL